MSRLAAAPFNLPDETVLEFFPLDRLQSPILRSAADYWRRICGSRRFPSREELNPSGFSSALRHMALVRVIDGGADFEYRIVGDSLAGAFSVPLQNCRLGAIATEAPSTVTVIGGVYRRCIQKGEPLALGGTTGRNAQNAMFTHFEALVLPLGAVEHVIDHLLTFMVCEAPRP